MTVLWQSVRTEVGSNHVSRNDLVVVPTLLVSCRIPDAWSVNVFAKYRYMRKSQGVYLYFFLAYGAGRLV